MANNATALKEKLNDLGRKWYYAEGAEKKVLSEKISEILLDAPFPRFRGNTPDSRNEERDKYLSYFYAERFTAFNPNRSPFSAYYQDMYYSYYLKDPQNGDLEVQRHVTDGQRKYDRIDIVSYSNASEEDKDDKDVAQANAIFNSEEMSCSDDYLATESMLGLLLEILLYKKLHENRLNYFRTFFTQDVSWCLRTYGLNIGLQHEEDYLENMKVPFLDFTLIQTQIQLYWTLVAISKSRMKLLGDLVDGAEMTEIPETRGGVVSLPQSVYLSYFEKIEENKLTAAALSQQWKNYWALKHDYREKARQEDT